MSMTFAEMIAAAQDSGSGPMDTPPAGTHNGIVVTANAKRNKSGKLTIGILLKVEDGPNKGNGVWSNQYLSPENATALGIWFRTFEALGIPTAWWGQFADIDQAAAQASELIKSKQCQFVVAYREWQGELQADVKSIKKPSNSPAVAQAAPLAPAALPAAPLTPAPAPAATLPVAPAAVPVAPVVTPPAAPTSPF